MPADTRDTLTEDVLVKLEPVANKDRDDADSLVICYHDLRLLIAAARQLPAERAAREAAEAKLAFLEEKGLRVGSCKTSDKAEAYLAYVVKAGSEFDDSPSVLREIETAQRIATIEAERDAAVKAEREAILKIVHLRSTLYGGEPLTTNEAAIVENIATAIRHRGTP